METILILVFLGFDFKRLIDLLIFIKISLAFVIEDYIK